MTDLKDKLKFLHLGSGDGVTDDTFCDYISTYEHRIDRNLLTLK